MGVAGRALVEKEFSWRAATDRLLSVYGELLAQRIRCRLHSCFERCANLLAPHSDAEDPFGQSAYARSRAAAAVSRLAPRGRAGRRAEGGAVRAPSCAPSATAPRHRSRRRQPDICCDLHELEWRGDPFDTVLAIEVLEHLYDPQRAIDRIHDVLKPGGICILSTRFMYRYHPDPQDHYRFTWDSLRHLFRNFRHVEVIHHGNRLQVIWEIINAGGRSRVVLNLLNPLVASLARAARSSRSGSSWYAQK